MAHTNQTHNYGLSQFEGTDKPAWLVDYNGDMEKIDLGLKGTKDIADAAKVEADQGALDIAAVTVTANSADAKASGAISNTADVYDATSTYNVGDFVIYNNILYRCITNITVPESFDGTHWTRTTIEEIATGLSTGLAEKQNKTWNQVTFIPGSTTHFYVPSDAKEIEVTALIYINDQNRTIKWLLTDNDMFNQIIYGGYYDGSTPIGCSLDVDGANRIVGAGSFVYGTTVSTPAVRARWR